MSKRKRIALIIGSVVFAVAIFLWFFGDNLGYLFVARWTMGKDLVVKQTPMPLANTAVSAAPGQTLSTAGYEFEVPWKGIAATRVVSERLFFIKFQSGVALLVGHGEPNEETSFASGNAETARRAKVLFGSAFDSDYSFSKAMLETTPDSITLFGDKRENARRALLLAMKVVNDGKTGIYRISSNGMKGFQYENPEAHPKRVIVVLYSDEGSLAFTFLPSPDRPLTQPEINRVIQTLRKAKLSPEVNSR